MSELAKQLIEENLRTQNPVLDLGSCGLDGSEACLEQLKECVHLDTLILSNVWYEADDNSFNWYSKSSINTGDHNTLKEVPQSLPHSLKELRIMGEWGYRWFIQDLKPLQNLENLRLLLLSSNSIDNLYPIQNLRKLRELFVSYNAVKDIQPIGELHELERLHLVSNKITEITSLHGLSKLWDINLSGNAIADISPLGSLENLKCLRIGQTFISGLSPLKKLSAIEELNLKECGGIEGFSGDFLFNFPNLKYLSLFNSAIDTAPPELYNKKGNCLPALRTYFTDLAQGNKVHQSKVILIGNGRTGKTCLVKRWLDESFDANEASTHAIQLRSRFLPQLAEAQSLNHVQLNIWDFGGQDIYHSTHQLFMQTQALFVLVWDAETEQSAQQEEVLEDGSTITYQNHPLTYWLDYAKVLGKDSPILVVQTKKEQHGEQVPQHWNALKARYNLVGHVSVDSALEGDYKNGFRQFRTLLEDAIYNQIETACTDLPSSWWQVRQDITKLQGGEQKTLSQEAFSQICKQASLGEDSQKTLRNYLHDTGFFFYRSGLFDDAIIIDQRWAIEAVYTLLDRTGMFMKYRGKGFFKGEDLSLVWSNRSLAEQELLLSFMTSCEMCVEVSRFWGRDLGRFVSFEKREYLAPQLLPDEPIPNQADIFPPRAKGVYVKVKHAFLHAGIMQGFIVRYAQEAQRENIKKYCIYLTYEGQRVLVQALPSSNEIVVRLASPKNDETLSSFGEVLHSIRQELKQLSQHATNTQETVSIDGQGYVAWEALQNHPKENKKIKADNGKYYDFEEFAVFLNGEHRAFNHPLKPNNGVATVPSPALQAAVAQALQHLQNADIAGYFETLNEGLIPEHRLYDYNHLKQRFIGNGAGVEYAQQLRVFAQDLLWGG